MFAKKATAPHVSVIAAKTHVVWFSKTLANFRIIFEPRGIVWQCRYHMKHYGWLLILKIYIVILFQNSKYAWDYTWTYLISLKMSSFEAIWSRIKMRRKQQVGYSLLVESWLARPAPISQWHGARSPVRHKFPLIGLIWFGCQFCTASTGSL